MPNQRIGEMLTTGEVAALCSVTPDTVLKWIRAGKLPADRTPGGHHRIPYEALRPLFKNKKLTSAGKIEAGSFTYCWEYYSKSGKISADCKQCIVYRSGTRRCYEINGLPVEVGHARSFCKTSCEDCDFYKLVKDQSPNVLIVTDKEELIDALQSGDNDGNFGLRITDCEYRCSMEIEDFRPDYVVIDCTIGAERSRDFAKLLYEDPRIPYVRVILSGDRKEIPRECDRLVYAYIKRPFNRKMLADIVGGSLATVNRQPNQ